jgi:ribosomal protein L7/L12
MANNLKAIERLLIAVRDQDHITAVKEIRAFGKCSLKEALELYEKIFRAK